MPVEYWNTPAPLPYASLDGLYRCIPFETGGLRPCMALPRMALPRLDIGQAVFHAVGELHQGATRGHQLIQDLVGKQHMDWLGVVHCST